MDGCYQEEGIFPNDHQLDLTQHERGLWASLVAGDKLSALVTYKGIFGGGSHAGKQVIDGWLVELATLGEEAMGLKLLVLFLERRYGAVATCQFLEQAREREN